jgi:hypothetical protein
MRLPQIPGFRWKLIPGRYKDDRGGEGDVIEKPKYVYTDDDGYKIVLEVRTEQLEYVEMNFVSIHHGREQYFPGVIKPLLPGDAWDTELWDTEPRISIHGFNEDGSHIDIPGVPDIPAPYILDVLIRTYAYAMHALLQFINVRGQFLYNGMAHVSGYSKRDVLQKFQVFDTAFRLNGFEVLSDEETDLDENNYATFDSNLDKFDFNGSKFAFTFGDYYKKTQDIENDKKETASSEERGPRQLRF